MLGAGAAGCTGGPRDRVIGGVAGGVPGKRLGAPRAGHYSTRHRKAGLATNGWAGGGYRGSSARDAPSLFLIRSCIRRCAAVGQLHSPCGVPAHDRTVTRAGEVARSPATNLCPDRRTRHGRRTLHRSAHSADYSASHCQTSLGHNSASHQAGVGPRASAPWLTEALPLPSREGEARSGSTPRTGSARRSGQSRIGDEV